MSSGPKISHDVLQTVCKKRKEKQSRSLIDFYFGKIMCARCITVALKVVFLR